MICELDTKGMFGNYFFPLFFIFKTKKLVWEPKIDRKQKLFSKFNL